jgi:hypothetical protein
MIVGIIVIIVSIVILIFYIAKSGTAATPPSVSSTGMLQPGGTGDSSAGSGIGLAANTPAVSPPLIKFSPPVDNTSINTGSSAPSVDGAATAVAPTPAPVAVMSDPGTIPKGILLRTGLNFTNMPFLVTTESSGIRLARYESGKYNFGFKSMQVEPGVKIRFIREDSDGKSPIVKRLSFAVGQYNVPDIEKWIRAYDRISGAGNMGRGSLGLNSPPNPGFESIIRITAMPIPSWETAITEERAACMSVVDQIKKSGVARASPSSIDKEANCGAITVAEFSTVFTRP